MIALWLLGCSALSTVSEGELELLTYNVHGLPSVVTGDDTLGRLAQIAPLLDAYDYVGIQEDFTEEGQALLDAGTSLPFMRRFDEKLETERVYGSGLTSYSRMPIVASEGVHFQDCHGFVEGASDCFASKGFQVLEVQLGSEFILQVVNTHMEAGGGPEDQAARAGNVEELLLGMSALSLEHPLVFLGDTNLHPEDPVDGLLSMRFEEELGLEDVCKTLNCEEPNRIDRIYFRSGKAVELVALEWRVAPEFVDAEGAVLSDHDAIAARFRWAKSAPID
ncbi:MAG: endonuclease/exonuclease/phosphatase family protein [Myxococcota bacterium]|nr:endonuclease/exonuclease/phosphatase family protein [Myxococcota bacterium]